MPWSEKAYVELIRERAEKKRGQWTASVPTQETLALMYGDNFSDSTESFDQLLSKIDAEVIRLYRKYNRKNMLIKSASPTQVLLISAMEIGLRLFAGLPRGMSYVN